MDENEWKYQYQPFGLYDEEDSKRQQELMEREKERELRESIERLYY